MAVDDTRLRIGVVGLGAVAQSVHLPLIRRRWDLFELAAVADLSPAAVDVVGGQFGVGPGHRHATLTGMLDAEDLDAVFLLTPGSHGTAALECLRAGIAVFCEKPLAYSLAEAECLREVEEEAGRPLLLLGYMKEYDPALERMTDMLPATTEIRYIDVEVLHPSAASQLSFANLHPPAGDVDPEALAAAAALDRRAVVAALGEEGADAVGSVYANVVLGSLVHDLAVIRHLAGPIETVDEARRWARQDDPGSLEVTGRILADARVHIHWHYLPAYPRYRETVTVHHTAGTLQLVFTVPYLLNAPTELRVTSTRGDGESVQVVRSVEEAFERELVALHRMVTARVRAPTGVAAGLADIRTAQAIARALAAGHGLALSGEAAADGIASKTTASASTVPATGAGE